jgi:hypothetical protein
MRKLAILLGTLAIAASAFAGGKEPVAPEVTTVVRETVVYQKNGGYVAMFYRWWGPSNTYKSSGDVGFVEWTDLDDDGVFSGTSEVLYAGKIRVKSKERQANGNRGRLHIEGSVNFGESSSVFFRARTNRPISPIGKETVSMNIGSYSYSQDLYSRSGDSDDIRIGFNFKHDLLSATSRIRYQNNGEYSGFGEGNHNLEYQFRIPMAQYLFDNDFIKTASFTVYPYVGYTWANSFGDTSTTKGAGRGFYGGIGIDSVHQLPLNFSFEFNLRAAYFNANYDKYDDSKSTLGVYAEIYLHNKTKLAEFGNSSLFFTFDGGYDPYRWASKKLYGHSSLAHLAVLREWDATKSKFKDPVLYTTSENSKSSYSLFAFPALQLETRPFDNTLIYVQAGAEIRNIYETSTEAQGWVWQPRAEVGFRIDF